jgi:hypothetical protein
VSELQQAHLVQEGIEEVSSVLQKFLPEFR